jgi:hypothetical protein
MKCSTRSPSSGHQASTNNQVLPSCGPRIATPAVFLNQVVKPNICILTMNTECNRIAHHLASTIDGEAWYGDSLHRIIDKVGATQASAHPISNAHSIWEIVRHLDAWVKFALGAIQGFPIPPWPSMAKEQDWPSVNTSNENAWHDAVNSLLSNYRKLYEEIKASSDNRLNAVVPGRTYDFHHLFHSMIQHAVYHSGQIALLNKATYLG